MDNSFVFLPVCRLKSTLHSTDNGLSCLPLAPPREFSMVKIDGQMHLCLKVSVTVSFQSAGSKITEEGYTHNFIA